MITANDYDELCKLDPNELEMREIEAGIDGRFNSFALAVSKRKIESMNWIGVTMSDYFIYSNLDNLSKILDKYLPGWREITVYRMVDYDETINYVIMFSRTKLTDKDTSAMEVFRSHYGVNSGVVYAKKGGLYE